MKKHLALSFFLLLVLAANAQYSPKPDSTIKVIPDGRHELYTIGGKLVTPADVKVALMSYSPSAAEYQVGKRDATAGFICIGAAGVTGILTLVEFARDNKVANTTLSPNGGFITVNRSKLPAEILLGTAIGTTVAAISLLVRSVAHARRSVDLYNKHLL